VDGPEHAVIPKLIKGQFPQPSEVRKDLPAALNAITMRALALKREERFASSHDFAEALAGFLYSSVPRFSAMTLSYFVQELFREELARESREAQVPPSFRQELEQWKLAPTFTPQKGATSTQVKTRQQGMKEIPREALRPSQRLAAMKQPAPREELNNTTRESPVEKADPIALAATIPLSVPEGMFNETSETLPRLADETEPALPSIIRARRRLRFLRYSLQVLTLASMVAIVIAIILLRRGPLQAVQPSTTPPGAAAGKPLPQEPTQPRDTSVRPLVDEAYKLVEQKRYTEAAAVLSRCLQLAPAHSECRLLQTSVHSHLQQEAPKTAQ
jgi:serine/threonine-protein kinase